MTKRKIFTLVLAVLLLVTTLPIYAAADAYIPPEEPVYGYNILTAHEKNNTCKPLNTFLSNFVEMGIKEYYLDTPDEEVIAYVLKHIELNAKYYGDVSSSTKDDGRTYMTLTQELFHNRTQHLFDRNIPAQNCPGYDSNRITVTADHYGGPIDVIANVNSCYEMGNGLYEAFFDVYFIHTDFSGWYTTAYHNLPLENLTHRGTGRAIVSYAGGQTLDTISTSHFSLVEWQMDAWGIAAPGDNVPYGYVEETLPPETEPPTEAPTEAETAPPETEAATLPVVVTPAPSFDNQKDDVPVAAATTGVSSIILIVALVCIAALLAAVILLLIALKNKK